MSDIHSESTSHSESDRTLSEEAVHAIENLSGVHPGYRRAHAKGICAHAVFHPSGLAAAFTTAPQFQEQEISAIVRFSGSSTDPAMADLLSPAKGMAVQFSLPGGGISNLVGVTVPVFFARTPESFVDMIRTVHQAQEGDLGPIDLIQEMISHFSESKESLMAVKHLKPPASYATCHYYCIHAYFLVDPQGNKRPVKFEWIPDEGIQTLSMKEVAQQTERYLEDELQIRLQRYPAVFQLSAILGKEDDPTDDPTQSWPDDRQRIHLGRLYIREIIQEPQDLVMDPTVISSGMALTDDPILRFRSTVYSESYHRRSQETKSP